MITKSGALQYLSKEEIALVTPDTSPRAGFYVDATTEKWKNNYNMYSYITSELPQIINTSFPIVRIPFDNTRVSIFGHSMGGHGAIMAALRNPNMFKSVSAFAPICHPSECAVGKKAFTEYLGANPSAWSVYDSTELAAVYKGEMLNILVDQGSEDSFLKDGALLPDHFVSAVQNSSKFINLETRVQPNYDHSYWFVQTFMEDHILFHSKHLK
ncbi:S-formylglutathione hydrolase [Zancudomyces culisetae]|uniref:S-formylglutathione hydrolase n=1 Tax=Zancudomyces culisetae TaxID=1213189 RepID=A0A1R1PD24_ZANCU|nr:S-formylglutathione hydrolase [Zancudomyces culisetae]|eukprot:OMH78821.1 S-formylglutathione hydrolase [Zancudomyces culisetae]